MSPTDDHDRHARHSLGMTRSDADLRRWAHEHLVYEVAMLSHAVDKFANKQLSDQDHNAFLESFAIHVRCLRDFLWGLRKKNNPQDAAAFDFCDPGVWDQARPPLPDALRAIEGDRRRIGREIVHLTYHRLDIEAETKDWDLTALMAGIAKGLHKFAEVAREERLHPRTREALALTPKDCRVLVTRDEDHGGPTLVAASIPVTGGTIAFQEFTADAIWPYTSE
jgi:hypothetical protein